MRNRLAKSSFDSSCWFNKRVNVVEKYKHWGPLEYSLPNSRIVFFYSCITQKFHVNYPFPSSTRTYFDGPDEIGDVYSKANSYQSHMMDISKELMTFPLVALDFLKTILCLRILHIVLGQIWLIVPITLTLLGIVSTYLGRLWFVCIMNTQRLP